MRSYRPSRPFVRSLVRDARGATITEYSLILFLVLVVAASGWKLLGKKVESGMGKAASNLEAPTDTPPAAPGGGGATAKPAAAAGGGGGTTGGGGGSFGGARAAPKEQEGSTLPKFALVALGIVGGAAAFFAMLKGKNAS